MRSRTRALSPILALVLATSLAGAAGCLRIGPSPGSTAGRTAGDALADRLTERVDDAAQEQADRFASALMSWMMNYMLQIAFDASGPTVEDAPYAPGDWTRFRVLEPDGTASAVIYRAFLSADDEGNEWWQVRFEDDESEEPTLMEAFFNPEGHLVRALVRTHPDEEPEEVLGSDHPFQRPDVRSLTADDIAEADQGTEAVTVPAGTFQARHLRMGAENEVRSAWWIVDEVPGGVVRMLSEESGSREEAPDGAEHLDADNYVLELVDHGTGAEPELRPEPEA